MLIYRFHDESFREKFQSESGFLRLRPREPFTAPHYTQTGVRLTTLYIFGIQTLTGGKTHKDKISTSRRS